MMNGFDRVDPTEAGFDAGRLAAIDRFVEDNYLKSGRFPGFSWLIARGGRIVHRSTLGYRNVAQQVPMTDDTIVRIYSMSKPITSMALLSLYEEGRVRLYQPVSTFIPSWGDLRVFADGTASNYSTRFPEREMTVHDLLTHTSGLTYSWMARHPVDSLYRRHKLDQNLPLDSYVEVLAGLPLLFSPGTRWSYSVATDVIGRLVEIISGQSFDSFLQEQFFDPLGMDDTAFWVGDDERAGRLAANYALPELSPIPLASGVEGDRMALIDEGGPDSPFRRKPRFLSGGGGLVSTLDDYLRFCQMLLNGGQLGGRRVLSRKTIELATSNHLPGGADLATMGQEVFSETPRDGVGFGLGFSVVLSPPARKATCSVGEYGWGG
ncbi:MAG: beta-lactamase family protein, partial [Acidimicrobiia bacterium]|nr:beta-lactamase family protein [Acidimicrobiia bacterium]